MPAIDERQWNLIVALVAAPGRRAMDKEEFRRRFPLAEEDTPAFIEDILGRAHRERDPTAVEAGLLLGFTFGFPRGCSGTLMELAEEPWHFAHENVIMALDRMREPAAIGTFYRTAEARLDYLAFDEAFALGVKCIWALGNLGEVEAVEALGKLALSEEPILAENARGQLRRVELEAKSAQARETARSLLARQR